MDRVYGRHEDLSRADLERRLKTWSSRSTLKKEEMQKRVQGFTKRRTVDIQFDFGLVTNAPDGVRTRIGQIV